MAKYEQHMKQRKKIPQLYNWDYLTITSELRSLDKPACVEYVLFDRLSTCRLNHHTCSMEPLLTDVTANSEVILAGFPCPTRSILISTIFILPVFNFILTFWRLQLSTLWRSLLHYTMKNMRKQTISEINVLSINTIITGTKKLLQKSISTNSCFIHTYKYIDMRSYDWIITNHNLYMIDMHSNDWIITNHTLYFSGSCTHFYDTDSYPSHVQFQISIHAW